MPSDHFSSQSAAYAQFRPRYPQEWFDWLVRQVPEQSLAWDCACGSGQATVATGINPIPELRERLAPFFTEEKIEVCWPLSIRAGRQS